MNHDIMQQKLVNARPKSYNYKGFLPSSTAFDRLIMHEKILLICENTLINIIKVECVNKEKKY